jgi:hypothetical protein
VAVSFIGGGREVPEKTTDLLQVTDKLDHITDTIAINVNFDYNAPAIIQNLQKRSNVLGVSDTVTIVSKHVTYFGP